MADLHNLTRDQLERLAGVLLQHVTDGDDQETTLAAARAILSEPRPVPAPTDREVVEEWVTANSNRAALVAREECGTFVVALRVEVRRMRTQHPFVSEESFDEAYAAAAERVRRQT